MKMEYVSLKVPINNEYWSAKKKQPLNLPVNLILPYTEVQISCKWVNLVHIVISNLKK